MYVVFKFSTTWSLYNATTRTSRALQPQQIDLIKELYSDDLKENAIFQALQITPISANKLQQLTAEPVAPTTVKKVA